MIPLYIACEFFTAIRLHRSEQRITQACSNALGERQEFDLLNTIPIDRSQAQFFIQHLYLSTHVVITMAINLYLHAIFELKSRIASTSDQDLFNIPKLTAELVRRRFICPNAQNVPVEFFLRTGLM